MNERAWHVRVVRQAGARQLERAVDTGLEYVFVRLGGCGLDHETDNNIVGVGIAILRAGVEGRRLAGDERKQFARRRRDLRGREESVDERVLAAEVKDTAGMVEELGERHGPPGLRQLGQPLADGIVKGELSARHERERSGSAERFRHARETHVVVDVNRPPVFDIRDPRGVDIDRFSLSHNDDDTGGATLAGHEVLQRALQRTVV